MKPIPEEEKGYREPHDVTEEDLGGYNDEERIAIEEVMDKAIVILAVDVRPSDFSDGDYATVQMVWDDDPTGFTTDPRTFTTSSGVLIKQLGQLKDKMPIRAKITKRLSETSGREYYTLTPPDQRKKGGRKEKKEGDDIDFPLTFTESEVKRGY